MTTRAERLERVKGCGHEALIEAAKQVRDAMGRPCDDENCKERLCIALRAYDAAVKP